MGYIKKSQNYTELYQSSLVQFFGLSIVWFLTIFLLRTVELILSVVKYGAINPLSGILQKGFAYDVVFYFKSLCALFIIHSLLSVLSFKLAKITFIITALLLVILQLSLSQYFFTALVPLGADVYSYSLADIRQTVGAAGGVPLITIISIIAMLGIVVGLMIKVAPKFTTRHLWLEFLLPVLSFIVLFTGIESFIASAQFGNEYSNYLTLNKSLYFINASVEHFEDTDNEIDIYADNYLGVGGSIIEGEEQIKALQYLAEEQYPFLRADSTADVLSPFMKPASQKPNIVIILVEGLGRAFSGDGAYLGSFTPFLDSLATKSLYWSNFMSEGGRTFAVLPSVLGSLPFGKSGFNELGNAMPNHLSLLSILKKNGYQSAFYYGGDSKFDNMKMFLQKGGIDAVYDEPTFGGGGYTRLPSGESGFSWGYDDKSLFKHFFDLNKPNDTQPKVQVILTVSTHSPFRISNQASYVQKVEKRMTDLKFMADQKSQTRPYNNMLSTVMYLDESLKYFFQAYQKRPDFANTIFLITGDHRMPEIPMATKIDRYHVPLYIYSPLLSRTSRFQSISTHFDITPTLLAYLHKSYGIKKPSVTNWIGTGIDTVRQFRNIHPYPVMMTKSQMVDFIRGPYMINNEDLYQITPTMGLVLTNDKGVKSTLKGAFDNFKQRNDKIVKGLKLLPDSVLVQYK